MYSVDDLVVYPGQGIGTILRIEAQKVGSIDCDFYIVRIQSNNITLMVPVKNAKSVGLRPLIDKDKAQDVLEIFRQGTKKSISTGQNWNRRFRDYSEKLKSPNLEVVAGVLRELLVIGRDKSLSYGERRLQEQAITLVVGELSTVLEVPFEELKDSITALYAPPQPKDS